MGNQEGKEEMTWKKTSTDPYVWVKIFGKKEAVIKRTKRAGNKFYYYVYEYPSKGKMKHKRHLMESYRFKTLESAKDYKNVIRRAIKRRRNQRR